MFGIKGNKGLMDAVVFGAGLTVGFILISGGLKLVDKATGGIIPDEFTQARYARAYQGFGSTLNTLGPGGDTVGMYDLS